MHRAKGDRFVRASELPVCDNDETLRNGSGNKHIWIKNSINSNRRPEYAKRTPLVDFFCKRVTIIASGLPVVEPVS